VTPADLPETLALIGVVILIAALLSGAVERSGIPQVVIFLGLGAALGPAGLGFLEIGLDTPVLHVAATLSLTLILFTDALSLDLRSAREHRRIALLAVGPGTALSAATFALLAWWLLDLSAPGAAIVGAALASTDPVLLRGLLRRPELPASARQALRLESGLNDVVLLPIVLVALELAHGDGLAGPEWARFALDLFLLGPGAGVAVGLLSIATLDLLRRRVGVRRDYESLYSLGVAFAAFSAAELVHGSGFLAAFAAGLTIAFFDVELCDCFREYGETTAELALLLTFVLLGTSLLWSGVAAATPAALVFAVLVLASRPLIYRAAFAGSRMEPAARRIVGWFGPRGLSSLLLALLAVFRGAEEGSGIFAATCLVVALSILVHGGTLVAWARGEAPPAPSAEPETITTEAVRTLLAADVAVIPVDVRKPEALAESDLQAAGARRVSPDGAARDARVLGLPSDAWLVLYCT
jgi:NhaP-type Na+/H+ or K+/H+ antiporter